MKLNNFGAEPTKLSFIHNPLTVPLASPPVLTPSVTYRQSKFHNTVQPVCSAATSTTPGPANGDPITALAELARIRELMGHFFVSIVVFLCCYTLLVECTANLSYDVGASILTAVCLLLGLLIPAILVVIKRTPLSLEFYGLTRAQWPAAIREAVLYSLPILALTVPAKWIAVQIVPRCHRLDLFSGRVTQYPVNGIHLLQLAIYIALVPVQEFIARGVLQGSLQEFLTGRHVRLKAVLISNLLFATFHLYVSPHFAVAVFLPGLVWGWLYTRHRTLIGVSVSHMLVGVWTLYVLGTHCIFLGGKTLSIGH
jgi:CRP/FNR family transcriptional regulator, cyclic AMP receptor protein